MTAFTWVELCLSLASIIPPFLGLYPLVTKIYWGRKPPMGLPWLSPAPLWRCVVCFSPSLLCWVPLAAWVLLVGGSRSSLSLSWVCLAALALFGLGRTVFCLGWPAPTGWFPSPLDGDLVHQFHPAPLRKQALLTYVTKNSQSIEIKFAKLESTIRHCYYRY